MSPTRRSRLRSVAAALTLVGLGSGTAHADTLTVTEHGDHAPGSCTAGDCTLREAVAAATAEDGNDRIELPGSEPYMLTRSSALPGPDDAKGDIDLGAAYSVSNDFKVIHPGPGRATIDATQADDRVLELRGVLRLVRITVRGGETMAGAPGGGISAPHGVIIMSRSRVAENHASGDGGGVHLDQGLLLAKRSSFRDNEGASGGGIFADPTTRLDLSRSTVSGNSAVAGGGGGIVAETGPFLGTNRIAASTIAHNDATGDGGGLMNAAVEFSIQNSTITKNASLARGGGIYSAPDTEATINAVTIARNRADADDSGSPDSGGGIFADGGSDVIELRNSLLALNRETGDAPGDCDAPAPVGIDSLGGNLLTDTANGCVFLDDPEDILDSEPQLGKLKDAGGPTETIPLKSDSPAIGQADGPEPPAKDQRGHQRGNPDIGAYER